MVERSICSVLETISLNLECCRRITSTFEVGNLETFDVTFFKDYMFGTLASHQRNVAFEISRKENAFRKGTLVELQGPYFGNLDSITYCGLAEYTIVPLSFAEIAFEVYTFEDDCIPLWWVKDFGKPGVVDSFITENFFLIGNKQMRRAG